MIAGLIFALVVALAAPTPPAEKPAYEPTTSYTVRDVEGWKVYVNNRLLGEKKALGDETLKLLAVHLYDVNRMAPKPALDVLHTVPIWVEAESKDVKCMCYHPSKGWLEGHGFNPDKAKSIELGNPVVFLDWTHHQRAMVLHELAHGYHHRIGYDNPDIKAAYQKAVESKSYESVLFYTGAKKKAYALNNDQEYFAELSEAYFSTNDFYPFVRPEIKEHDPTGYEMLKKVWDGK
jgi:hypothetical protein